MQSFLCEKRSKTISAIGRTVMQKQENIDTNKDNKKVGGPHDDALENSLKERNRNRRGRGKTILEMAF